MIPKYDTTITVTTIGPKYKTVVKNKPMAFAVKKAYEKANSVNYAHGGAVVRSINIKFKRVN